MHTIVFVLLVTSELTLIVSTSMSVTMGHVMFEQINASIRWVRLTASVKTDISVDDFHDLHSEDDPCGKSRISDTECSS